MPQTSRLSTRRHLVLRSRSSLSCATSARFRARSFVPQNRKLRPQRTGLRALCPTVAAPPSSSFHSPLHPYPARPPFRSPVRCTGRAVSVLFTLHATRRRERLRCCGEGRAVCWQKTRPSAALDRHRSGLLRTCSMFSGGDRLALASARGWLRSSPVACVIFVGHVTLS